VRASRQAVARQKERGLEGLCKWAKVVELEHTRAVQVGKSCGAGTHKGCASGQELWSWNTQGLCKWAKVVELEHKRAVRGLG